MAEAGVKTDQGKWVVMSTSPDVCLTPMGPAMVPMPYTIQADISDAVTVSKIVTANGKPVLLLDPEKAAVAKTKGAEAGTGGGLISGTVGAGVWPKDMGRDFLKIEGKLVVCEGDVFGMNGNDANSCNTVGKLMKMG